jgi:hypothetical protein
MNKNEMLQQSQKMLNELHMELTIQEAIKNNQLKIYVLSNQQNEEALDRYSAATSMIALLSANISTLENFMNSLKNTINKKL